MSEQIGRVLVIFGGVLVVVGLIILLLSRFIDLNNLPGTLRIESGNFRLVFPIAASIVLSIILTVVLNVIIRLFNR
jgi:hypothetical protein